MAFRGAAFVPGFVPALVPDQAALEVGRFADIERFEEKYEAPPDKDVNASAVGKPTICQCDLEPVVPTRLTVPIVSPKRDHTPFSASFKVNFNLQNVNLILSTWGISQNFDQIIHRVNGTYRSCIGSLV